MPNPRKPRTFIPSKYTRYMVCYKLPTIYCMQSVAFEVDPMSTSGNRLPERSKDLLKNYHLFVIQNYTTHVLIISEHISKWPFVSGRGK